MTTVPAFVGGRSAALPVDHSIEPDGLAAANGVSKPALGAAMVQHARITGKVEFRESHGGELLLAAVQKLVRRLSPRGATLAAVLSSPVPLASAAEAEHIAGRHAGRAVQALVQGSRHDGAPGLLPNTVVGLGWAVAAAAA